MEKIIGNGNSERFALAAQAVSNKNPSLEELIALEEVCGLIKNSLSKQDVIDAIEPFIEDNQPGYENGYDTNFSCLHNLLGTFGSMAENAAFYQETMYGVFSAKTTNILDYLSGKSHPKDSDDERMDYCYILGEIAGRIPNDDDLLKEKLLSTKSLIETLAEGEIPEGRYFMSPIHDLRFELEEYCISDNEPKEQRFDKIDIRLYGLIAIAKETTTTRAISWLNNSNRNIATSPERDNTNRIYKMASVRRKREELSQEKTPETEPADVSPS